jgi:hypothetical protein
MIGNGWGVPQDYAEAAKWYRRAADRDYTEGQYNLGILYQQGLGVPQDYAEAARLYQLAISQYFAPAMNNLATMYHKGLGLPQDDVEAVRLYRHAADQGNAQAQNNLGTMYAMGQGVPQNYVQAHMWFSLSVALGDPVGTRNRDQAAALLTPAQLAESERLLRAWRPGPASVPSIVIGPQKAGSP